MSKDRLCICRRDPVISICTAFLGSSAVALAVNHEPTCGERLRRRVSDAAGRPVQQLPRVSRAKRPPSLRPRTLPPHE